MRLLAFLLAALVVLPAHAARQIEVVTSASGVTAWLMHEPKIPIIAVEAAWRGGTAMEPAGREGLAQMTMALLDEGSGPDDDLAFHGRLEARAIELGFDAGMDTLRARLRTLSEHREEAFRLLGQALTQPRFDPAPIARVRAQMFSALDRIEQDPNAVASRAFYRAAFPGHPYGRPAEGTRESIAAITRDDMVAFARQRLGRDNLLIGVVGDITAPELRRLLDLAFGALPAQSVAESVADTVIAPATAPTVIRRAQPQSVVMFGGPGLRRQDPDWYAAFILNYVLGGGGFNSRLMTEVREKRGLAYSAYAYLAPMEHAGIQVGGVGTRNDAVAQSIELIKAEIGKIRAEGISAEELDNAKRYLTGSFPLQLSSNGRIAGFLVSMQINRLGADFIQRYAGYIEAVTMADIRRVAQRLIDPATMQVIVVGQPEGLGG